MIAKDPVCGMAVDEERAPATTRFGGATRYFCSVTCKMAFDQAPATYDALARRVPPALARLLPLARNLWWTWHPEARALFEGLRAPWDSAVPDNPIQLLLGASPEALAARSEDAEFRARYEDVISAFEAETTPQEGRSAWAARGPGPVGYFSAEFGVHGSLPIYSGGLGVLAGDIVKESSDLGLPLVGVGFMYPQGYFRQGLTPEGWQEERYETLVRALAPTEPACTVSGHACEVALELSGRRVRAAVWRVGVGRVSLYLMDTDLEGNPPWDRELSSRLYGGDQEFRLRQEILLGIGGVRLLRALGVAPAVWHANEGHSAFMMVERVRELVEAGRRFEEAVDEVRASTVFTTHTPVAAGHDAFPFPLIEKYLGPYWSTVGLNRDRFLALGAHPAVSGTAFNMTALALRLSGTRNAVSRRHGEVSRRMWRGLWPGVAESEVPIASVTNGVHLPSWLAPELGRLYDEHLGPGWLERHDDPETWRRLDDVPDRELWDAHVALKRRLLAFLRERARRLWAERSTPAPVAAAGALLDPGVLTLGFARRFATYKRATLVFRDPARLKALVTDLRRPVQLIFAGKAHPADESGKHALQAVYRTAADPAYAGRIAFVEDYDMHVARQLVQGVDVWLNTPRPPLEASGTSGQKAALNGVPNLSVLDGWWLEAYDGTNGWAFGNPDETATDPDDADRADADALYRVLETEVVPRFYSQAPGGVPGTWIATMKRSIQTVAPRFSARRMVKEYVDRCYAPARSSP
jgi:starch phosphorylase